jgi:hypothetical protein
MGCGNATGGCCTATSSTEYRKFSTVNEAGHAPASLPPTPDDHARERQERRPVLLLHLPRSPRPHMRPPVRAGRHGRRRGRAPLRQRRLTRRTPRPRHLSHGQRHSGRRASPAADDATRSRSNSPNSARRKTNSSASSAIQTGPERRSPLGSAASVTSVLAYSGNSTRPRGPTSTQDARRYACSSTSSRSHTSSTGSPRAQQSRSHLSCTRTGPYSKTAVALPNRATTPPQMMITDRTAVLASAMAGGCSSNADVVD